MMRPAVDQSAHEPGDRVANAVRDNVVLVVQQLLAAKPVLAELAETGKLRIVGAVYSLETGKVDWLPAAAGQRPATPPPTSRTGSRTRAPLTL